MGHATWSIGVFTALEYFTKNRPISHKIMLSAQVSVRKQLVIIIGNNQKIAFLHEGVSFCSKHYTIRYMHIDS